MVSCLLGSYNILFHKVPIIFLTRLLSDIHSSWAIMENDNRKTSITKIEKLVNKENNARIEEIAGLDRLVKSKDTKMGAKAQSMHNLSVVPAKDISEVEIWN